MFVSARGAPGAAQSPRQGHNRSDPGAPVPSPQAQLLGNCTVHHQGIQPDPVKGSGKALTLRAGGTELQHAGNPAELSTAPVESGPQESPGCPPCLGENVAGTCTKPPGACPGREESRASWYFSFTLHCSSISSTAEPLPLSLGCFTPALDLKSSLSLISVSGTETWSVPAVSSMKLEDFLPDTHHRADAHKWSTEDLQ